MFVRPVGLKDDDVTKPFEFERVGVDEEAVALRLGKLALLRGKALRTVVRFVQATWNGGAFQRTALVIRGAAGTGKSRLLVALWFACAPGTVLLDYDSRRAVGANWHCLAMVPNGFEQVFPADVTVREVELEPVDLDELKAAGIPLVLDFH